MRIVALGLVLLLLVGVPAAESQVTAVRFGRMLDSAGNLVRDAVVLVEGERITAAGSRASVRIPRGARIVDLSRFTGLPGLVDVHVHMTYFWDQKPGTQPWSQLGRRPPAMTLYLAQENARRALESGVTTVRDLHASGQLGMNMRDLIAEGAMVGPRMVVAGCGLGLGAAPAAFSIFHMASKFRTMRPGGTPPPRSLVPPPR
mgnify:CR=1 FL=1